MFPEADLFVEGERQLGHYSVAIARYGGSGWAPTIPPLHVLITNRRMFLRPQVRKHYQPASIPREYITKVEMREFGIRHGLSITLKTGHQIFIFISKDQAEQLISDINVMKLPAPRLHFDQKVVERDIQRLIDFINNL